MQVDDFADILNLMDYWPRIYEISSKTWDIIRDYLLEKFKLDKIAHDPKYQYFILIIVFINSICVLIYAFSDPSN